MIGLTHCPKKKPSDAERGPMWIGGVVGLLVAAGNCFPERKCPVQTHRSQPGEAKGTDNPLGDESAALSCDTAALFDQLRLGRGIDYVAFAERLPVQTIRYVQDHFVQLRFARRPLRRAEQYANPRFERDSLVGAQQYDWVLASIGASARGFIS